MNHTNMERVASIVVLAIIVTVVLIADIAGTAVGTSRFLGVIGLVSLFGLLRHGLFILRSYIKEAELLLESEALSSGVRAALYLEHHRHTL